MGDPLTVRRSAAVLALASACVGLSVPSSAVRASAAPPDSPSGCTADAISADTGLTLLPAVVCSAGFAAALVTPVPSEPGPDMPNTGSSTTPAPPVPCEHVDECNEADIFHVTMSGWVYDGRHDRSCAENLGVAFMSPQTAATFAPTCDDAAPEAETVSPGDAGTSVMYVQIALIALGHDVAVDGSYDSAMEHVVGDLQLAYGLEPNGIVGPDTHALLGTGPPVPGAPTPTTTTTSSTSSSTTTTMTSTTTSTTTSTVPAPSGMAPGTPRPCTVAAVAADTGLPVVFVGTDCHAGWALGMLSTTCPPTDEPDVECETVDVFHVERDGWVHSGFHYPYCAEALAEGSGMSIHTALAWSPICGDAPVPERMTISPGSDGPAVRLLQIALVALGYPIEVDGEYGPRTEAAVRDFQQRNGLAVDGVAGPDTQVALGI